jgi:hypothetical protein
MPGEKHWTSGAAGVWEGVGLEEPLPCKPHADTARTVVIRMRKNLIFIASFPERKILPGNT